MFPDCLQFGHKKTMKQKPKPLDGPVDASAQARLSLYFESCRFNIRV